MDLKKRFGLCCQQLRKNTGLSQEKFALTIGLDRTYYSSVESGKRNVSLINIQKIADGFGISIHTLFLNMESIDDDIMMKEE